MGTNIGRQHGRISKWIEDRGFGFIRPDAGGPDVFAHFSQILRGDTLIPLPGEGVYYDLDEGPKGLRALNLSFESDGL